MPANVIKPSFVARLASDDTESSSLDRSMSTAGSMVARLLTSRTDCPRISFRLSRAAHQLPYYLIGYPTATLASSACNYQISTVVGIEVGGINRVGKGVFSVGDVRAEVRRHREYETGAPPSAAASKGMYGIKQETANKRPFRGSWSGVWMKADLAKHGPTRYRIRAATSKFWWSFNFVSSSAPTEHLQM